MPERSRDLILFGATGYTGKIVAEYLLRHAPPTFRWALAGRNATRLGEVREDLARVDERARALPIVVADAKEKDSLRKFVADTRVVCTTVGPYLLHGKELVQACAELGTHYCDLTGEVPFMLDTVERHHEVAKKSGARIVHACGFDSIPSDLGVLMLQEEAERRGVRLSEVKFFAGESHGGFSGGTVASMLNLVDQASQNPGLRKTLADPFALDPERRGREFEKAMEGVRYDADVGMWTAPFLMAPVNTRVVNRSNALNGRRYGPNFRYSERMSCGRGATGFARAAAVAAGISGFMFAAIVPFTRPLLQAILPKPGAGPSPEVRARGFFVVRLVALARDERGEVVKLFGRVEGKSDPGYGETAKMLGESALCLALDSAQLPPEGGVLTPSVAMGRRLLERLRAADMVFEVS